jgi:GNAT superfamily N-acetyltransferase
MVGRDRHQIGYRLVKLSDIPQLVNLMNIQYARKKDESYFLWQYFNSHYPAVLMCAFIDDRVVGMFGLQKKRLNNGAVVGQAIDLLVAPEWRGKGIFKNLGEKTISCFDDLDLLCVFPNRNGKIACEKGLGWKTIGKINSMSLNPKDLKGCTLESDLENKNKFYKFHYNKNIRNWRFDQHPEYKYSYVPEISSNFVVTKVFINPVNGERMGDIVDLECDLYNKFVLGDIFMQGCLHLINQNVKYITTWALPHTPLYEIVSSLGFTELPQERYFCLKILNPEYEYLYDLNRWHLVQADTEIY